jgi:hypothetical protein
MNKDYEQHCDDMNIMNHNYDNNNSITDSFFIDCKSWLYICIFTGIILAAASLIKDIKIKLKPYFLMIQLFVKVIKLDEGSEEIVNQKLHKMNMKIANCYGKNKKKTSSSPSSPRRRSPSPRPKKPINTVIVTETKSQPQPLETGGIYTIFQRVFNFNFNLANVVRNISMLYIICFLIISNVYVSRPRELLNEINLAKAF